MPALRGSPSSRHVSLSLPQTIATQYKVGRLATQAIKCDVSFIAGAMAGLEDCLQSGSSPSAQYGAEGSGELDANMEGSSFFGKGALLRRRLAPTGVR
jgi:hypothetical protein